MLPITTIDLHFQGNKDTVAAFLIETNNGPILVETGPHSTLPYLEVALAKKGYKIDDIKHVFLTHIHLDHAGCAWYFAQRGAKIYVHPKGFKHLASPERLLASATQIYQEKMATLWGEMHPISPTQLVATDDQQIFKIGGMEIMAHFTPGHAMHHIAWQVDKVVFSGDVAGVKIPPNGPVMPPCPPPDINIEEWIESIDRLRSLDLEAIYLTHFGRITNIQVHLQQLEDILHDWAQWMKPHFDAATDTVVVTPQFRQYVIDQLLAAGVSAEGLAQYDNANPAWMSVAGLMRYWKIKART